MKIEPSGAPNVGCQELELYLNNLLEVSCYKDYCPNGLQVAGRTEIRKVVTGVTASLALIDAALAAQADAILVHHGYFWRGEDARIIGMKQRRLQSLLRADVNLLAYHLPLDGHTRLGNNAQLAEVLGLQADGRFGEQNIGWQGAWALPAFTHQPPSAAVCLAHLSQCLGRQALLVGDAQRLVKRVAWCTGGAQGYFEAAIAQGVDLYISGEISEQTTHLARESGVAYIAAGHHATERYGIQAVGRHLAEQFGVEHEFIEIDNPA